MKNSIKVKYILILVIFLFALASSLVLAFVPTELSCGKVESTCYAVQTSSYETTLGIKNSIIGIVAFSLLSLITLLHILRPKKYQKQLLVLGISLASLMALYFLYLQLFEIKAVCKYCLIVDIGTLLNLGIITFWREK